MVKEQLRTVQLVPVTPFDANGRLALDAFRELIARTCAAGIRVFVPGAGTGEFHSLADEEIVALAKAARKAIAEIAGAPSLVMSPLGGALQRAVELSKRAADAGADCGLVMPLEFPFLCDASAGEYLRELLDRSAIPLLIYKKADVPSNSLLLDIAAHPKLLGIKYAVNDLGAFQAAIDANNKDVDWYCGSAERFAPYFALAGAPGYTSGAGVICPRLTLAMHAALAAGRWEEAMRLQRRILPIELFRAKNGSSYNISFLKHAVKLTGIDCGQPRAGQRRLTKDEERQVEEAIEPVLAAERDIRGG